MNRLTIRNGQKTLVKTETTPKEICIGCETISACTSKCKFYHAIEKLAAYEDTGLEPEQIKSFLKDFGVSVVMKNTKLMNELKEYKDLEEQGLLIKLPCKVGYTVYVIHEVVKCPPFIEPIKFKVSLYDLLNKSVFLTREEAEKALEVENENQRTHTSTSKKY